MEGNYTRWNYGMMVTKILIVKNANREEEEDIR